MKLTGEMTKKPNKREKQKQETLADILRVGEELFVTQGFENTSIAQIADACGMTKGAMYHHFDSKEALMEEICQRHYDFLLETARPFLARKDLHWFMRMGLVIDAVRKANEERLAVAGEYLQARRSSSGQFAVKLSQVDREFYKAVFASVLAEARDLNEASFTGSAEMLAVFVYHVEKAMTDEIASILEEEKPKNFKKRATEIMETFVHALSSLLGIDKVMILQLVKIPETISYMAKLLKKQQRR